MKKTKLGSRKLVIIPICVVLCLALAPAVVAAAGGMPGAHGVSGEEFGALVSELAKSDPGAVAAHMGGGAGVDAMGGMAAAHEVDGRTFGEMVSELAASEPGAVAAHIGECAAEVEAAEGAGSESAAQGGIPAIHGISGRDFGAAAAGLARSAPGAVAAHIGVPIPSE